MSDEKCSLWIMPEGNARQVLESYVTLLSKHLGSRPVVPHLTLLGSLDVSIADAESRCQEIAKMLRPFDMDLEGIQTAQEFYRAIYYSADMTGSLMHAYSIAATRFGIERAWYPHLSLYYGMASENEKRISIEKIRPLKRLSFQVAAVHLYQTNNKKNVAQFIGTFPFQY